MDELDFAELEGDIKEAISHIHKSEVLLKKVLKRIEKVPLVKM